MGSYSPKMSEQRALRRKDFNQNVPYSDSSHCKAKAECLPEIMLSEGLTAGWA